MLSEEILDREDVCAVCGSKLETAYYADIDSFDGRTDWLGDIKVTVFNKYGFDRKSKTLKCCSRCGLLYAK